MITCTLKDKKYAVDFISGRALREMEPAVKMYAKIVQRRRQGRRDPAIGTGQHSGRNGRDDPLVLSVVRESVQSG